MSAYRRSDKPGAVVDPSLGRGPRLECPACGSRHDAYAPTINTVWVPKAWHRPDGDYLRQSCKRCGAVWRRLPLEPEVMG